MHLGATHLVIYICAGRDKRRFFLVLLKDHALPFQTAHLQAATARATTCHPPIAQVNSCWGICQRPACAEGTRRFLVSYFHTIFIAVFIVHYDTFLLLLLQLLL